jgi:hypothetical protein
MAQRRDADNTSPGRPSPHQLPLAEISGSCQFRVGMMMTRNIGSRVLAASFPLAPQACGSAPIFHFSNRKLPELESNLSHSKQREATGSNRKFSALSRFVGGSAPGLSRRERRERSLS